MNQLIKPRFCFHPVISSFCPGILFLAIPFIERPQDHRETPISSVTKGCLVDVAYINWPTSIRHKKNKSKRAHLPVKDPSFGKLETAFSLSQRWDCFKAFPSRSRYIDRSCKDDESRKGFFRPEKLNVFSTEPVFVDATDAGMSRVEERFLPEMAPLNLEKVYVILANAILITPSYCGERE
ncbi:hypothetical protein SAY86_000611 [Trapa natans]|uniref:Uncharacterized protein n=1 Tax=Trapa natans TaxID=22666 RepID=A0AAN7M4A0_TRANT|nr:hypothetical protein SAY86_000611 [Trapa natans]